MGKIGCYPGRHRTNGTGSTEWLPSVHFRFHRIASCVHRVPLWRLRTFPQARHSRNLPTDLPEDEEPYQASACSRFDSPEFYAVFASFLRILKLFQSVRGALERPGFFKDLKAIASATSNEFVQAALHESRPQSNSDLIHTAGSEKVCTGFRHLMFFTATSTAAVGSWLAHFNSGG